VVICPIGISSPNDFKVYESFGLVEIFLSIAAIVEEPGMQFIADKYFNLKD
jgi:hypothetical protein